MADLAQFGLDMMTDCKKDFTDERCLMMKEHFSDRDVPGVESFKLHWEHADAYMAFATGLVQRTPVPCAITGPLLTAKLTSGAYLVLAVNLPDLPNMWYLYHAAGTEISPASDIMRPPEAPSTFTLLRHLAGPNNKTFYDVCPKRVLERLIKLVGVACMMPSFDVPIWVKFCGFLISMLQFDD